MCQNEGAGLYPYPHSFHPFFPPDPGGCRGYADVAQLVEHRTRRYALVQAQPSAQDAGSHPDNVRPFVMAHMEMKMVAENCAWGCVPLAVTDESA
mgnify:CR=1 FL=1